MSRTRRHGNKFQEALRSAIPYKRPQRRKLLKDFERQYAGRAEKLPIEL
ncbi:MAG TPA: hypothetical protein PLN95_00275 [Candidatus Saccharibacteria bacterium]|nr:hypothetical protein [Candidatus Saccharibacteria bacterium]